MNGYIELTLLVVFFHIHILDFSYCGLFLDLSICLPIYLYIDVAIDTPSCRVRLVMLEDLGNTSANVDVCIPERIHLGVCMCTDMCVSTASLAAGRKAFLSA